MAIVSSLSKPVAAAVPAWQTSFKTAIRSGVELCRRLNLPSSYERAAAEAEQSFPVFAPLSYVAKMRTGDPNDPLLKQVLPIAEETVPSLGFTPDPVGDQYARKTSGLLQKYNGRVLILTTGACAIHCRYCFRRHFPYSDGASRQDRWQEAIDYVARDESIHEVILSGGDPLTVSDEQLEDFVRKLARLRHVRRLRIHSRLPVVIPERVTEEMVGYLRGTRLTPFMVIHANHPRELGDDVVFAIGRLVDAGIPVLNQSVLLCGVNDSVEVLAELSERLIDVRAIPYYLHQLDRVSGAVHFEVPLARGLLLMEQLRSRLPGYAIPRYVQEVAGDIGKRWLS